MRTESTANKVEGRGMFKEEHRDKLDNAEKGRGEGRRECWGG